MKCGSVDRLGVTRSGLIATALAEFVAKHRGAKRAERLDAVYAAEESWVDRSWRAHATGQPG